MNLKVTSDVSSDLNRKANHCKQTCLYLRAGVQSKASSRQIDCYKNLGQMTASKE